MTHQEIKALAGHRAVPPWIMKLVGDAVAAEREACAQVLDEMAFEMESDYEPSYAVEFVRENAAKIRARGQQ